MEYPKIYLVLDNCFAIKRWVKPADWLELTREIGFSYAQASTDNEIDPLFSTVDYMDDWFEEVKQYEKKTGVKVINFYTGYQTYRTVGLAHHDARIRRKLMEGWFKPLIQRIADLGAAGLGFSYFAIPDAVLQDPIEYQERTEIILDLLGELAEHAYINNRLQVSFEQMYAPHQPPWTISGSRDYLKQIYARHQKPLYLTIDVGHMVGQSKFLKPTPQVLANSLSADDPAEEALSPIWLGSDEAFQIWSAAKGKCKAKDDIEGAIRAINFEMDKYPYLFAEPKDGDPYGWLQELGCFSPIIHMQQTNGRHSSHAAFTPSANKEGIITGDKLLHAIASSYQRQRESGMPETVGDIFLSFEIFASNIETKAEVIQKLKQTVAYWRRYVPEDGIPLDQLVKH